MQKAELRRKQVSLCFCRWSRNAAAVFHSLHYAVRIGTLRTNIIRQLEHKTGRSLSSLAQILDTFKQQTLELKEVEEIPKDLLEVLLGLGVFSTTNIYSEQGSQSNDYLYKLYLLPKELVNSWGLGHNSPPLEGYAFRRGVIVTNFIYNNLTRSFLPPRQAFTCHPSNGGEFIPYLLKLVARQKRLFTCFFNLNKTSYKLYPYSLQGGKNIVFSLKRI